MTSYPYILKTGTIKSFMKKLPSVGVPDKVTQTYVYSLGFKSVNDRPVISVLKFIGFIDSSGSPTEKYKQYRNRSISSKVLGNSVREAYADVFKVYPDAHKKDHETLRNFFSTHTHLGERAINSIVETFKALCAISDFDDSFGTDLVQNAERTSKTNSEEFIGTDKEHKIELVLSEGRKARLILPQDITQEELKRLSKLLAAFEK